MSVVLLVQERGKERVSKLRYIAREEEHGWSIPEVLRADADLIQELVAEIERLQAEPSHPFIPGAEQLAALLAEKPRSPEWPHVRAEHLKKEPACRACGTKDALQVHHIKPFHLHPDLELDPSNLVTLCEKPGHYCHFRIGHFLNWTNFNPFAVADADRFREALAVARATAKDAA